MTLDPNARASWHGFLDLLRPPEGHLVRAAIGTSFGVSFDALLAALLAMVDTDAESLSSDPVAGVLAATRLSPCVRVLVHPGTIKGSLEGISTQLVGMLDRVLVDVPTQDGLFHPKLWLLRFSPRSSRTDDSSRDLVRLIVASRNLTLSRAFEAGVALEGGLAESRTQLGDDVASALAAWTRGLELRSPAVAELLSFTRQVAFDAPHEGRDGVRLRWQGGGRSPLHKHLPERLRRAVIVSPFLRPDFVQSVAERSDDLVIVSAPEGLSGLDADTLTALERAGDDSPHMFVVGEHGDPDDAFVDGVHAKLLLLDAPDGSVTYVGSANATGPGWGLGGKNAEAMLELRPGLSVTGFMRSFLLDQGRLRPWVQPFLPSDQEALSAEQELDRTLASALRRFGAVRFTLSYYSGLRRLVLHTPEAALPAMRAALPELELELAPLCKAGADAGFRAMAELEAGDLAFDEVSLEDVSAFVVMRARAGGALKTAVALGRLRMADDELDRRDDAVRSHVLSTARPEDVLRALVFGVAHLRRSGARERAPAEGQSTALRHLLEAVTLEAMLRAVAEDRALIRELRLVMGACAGEPFARFCDQLEAAAAAVYGGQS